MDTMNNTEHDMPECSGCSALMTIEDARANVDHMGRSVCVDCQLLAAEDAAAEREYRAELAAEVA